ncbi:HypC/HybG/HupF family hydrogenase formation chaperone [Cupriavidus taiwanensis]|uniref:Hydrogenase expression/formation protein HypC n=1 Tax=Cupriavidus taiwanensis TaxID=164546 RepID=A0A375JEF2_9BURK|nr:hypothetical protein CBM2634_P90009 [Cupriavidus taiwanensis]
MCLAIPARVVSLEGPDQAVVDLGGVRKQVSIALAIFVSGTTSSNRPRCASTAPCPSTDSSARRT